MFKTLKSKLSFIYICLVIIIGIVGIFSTFNTYTLNRLINGLMVDNYKSIKAITNMQQTLEEQDASILTYININHSEGINSFHVNENKFNQFYNIEANNITEPGEEELVKDLNASYIEYITLFSELQELSSNKDNTAIIGFYKNKILPQYGYIKNILNKLSLLNEKNMFDGKNRATDYAKQSIKITLFLSCTAAIIGFLISILSLNRFLRPIYSLRETMKAVKEGDLNQEAPIFSEDEIGDLTKEFNNMTKRLLQFEQSTLGQLLVEKNKSLAIVKSMADPLIVLDTNYKVVLLNHAFEDIFDVEESVVLNKHFLEVVKNGDLYDYITNIYASRSLNPESKIIYLDFQGKDYYFNIVVNVLRDMSDKITGLVVLFQNVTQLKLIEKVKSDFTATISHEFKTPLTSIMIGTSLISDVKMGSLNLKQKEIIEAISDDAEKLLSLVNNLLNLSKLESDKSVFSIKPHLITEVIENSIKNFSEQSKNKGITIHYELEPTLPKVNIDSEKITWVVNNLISNALKFTYPGGEIFINAFVKQNKMCVSINDTGMGIPEEYQEKIFDKFVQVPGENFEAKGTGLGLAIAKEIIEAHGGEIWCVSKLNEGSSFTFTLPIVEMRVGDLM